VFPVNSTSPFEDNACTLTQQASTALDVINPFVGEPTVQTTTDDVATTTTADVVSTEDPGTAEGPVAGEPVLVSGGTNMTPIVVSSIIVIAALGIAIFVWRRRSVRKT